MKTFKTLLSFLLFSFALSFAENAQPDIGASLTIRFAKGTSQFHVGEVVPIEMAFSASVADTYDMSTASYDRSGRLNMEQFHVTPPGRDPLHKYYSMGVFMLGGLSSSQILTSEPAIMREDLNEWVALDQPGHYTLYVTTGRVSKRGTTKNEAVELRSNSLEFDVVPADPEWQETVLRSATSILDSTGTTDGQRTGALRTLRFLDSPASVTELVGQMSKLPDGRRSDCVLGLAGSRYQSLVVRELEQQMATPDTAITSEYLFILGKLKFQLEHEPMPPYPDRDESQQKVWRERMQAQDQELGRLQDALYQRTAALLSTKRGVARAETVKTLVFRPAHEPSDIKPLAGLPEAEVADAFLSWSADQQWSVLAMSWTRLKGAAMIRPLEKIVEQPEIRNQMLRSVALKRLYELDPGAGAQRILEEIRHPHVDNGMFAEKAETLGMLSAETLPEFDQLLASRLEGEDRSTRGLDAQLIGRYATKSILPRVKAAFEAEPGPQDCVTADGLVSYFLRVEPDYGVRRLAQKPSACMTNSLAAIVRMKRWSEVEPAMIARLDDPDLNGARSAVETLAKYGSAKAERAMWGRLRRFHKQWVQHANDLNSRPQMPREALDAMGFQFGLVEALGRARGWVLSNEQITELELLTLGSEQENVKPWHWHSPVDLNHQFSI